MKKIQFDDIHSKNKQEHLECMSQTIAEKVSALSNDTPISSTCPLCGSALIEPYFERFNFVYHRCEHCAFVFMNPYPSSEQLQLYYNSEMKAFENEFFQESFERRVDLFMPRVEMIKEKIETGKLLDIGSAIGIFIEALHRSETLFDITCCDINEESCQLLTKKYPDIEVINANIFNAQFENRFDVITLWDTLEHIVNANDFLRNIKRLLRKDGMFIFSTPNTKGFEWRFLGTNHFLYLPPAHVHLFNTENAKVALEQNGLKVCSVQTLNASLDIGHVKKYLEKRKGSLSFAEKFMYEKLQEPDFESMLETHLIQHQEAGNMVILAQNCDE